MTKRIFAILMVLCMVFSLFPLSVLASEEEALETEPVETAVEEPAEEFAEEPEAEPVEELAEEPVETAVEEPAEEFAEEPAEEPAEELAEEPVETDVEEPAEEFAEEPTEEPAEEPAEELAEEPEAEPVEELAEEPEVAADGSDEELPSGSCGTGVTWAFSLKRVDNEGTDHEEYWYTLTISGSGAMEDYDYLWNEETRDWSEDSFFSPWHNEDRWHVVEIVIESGVTHIGNHAFRDFNNLESVSIPTGVKSIGAFAFSNCVRYEHDDETGTDFLECGLASIEIPTSVETIGERAFENCENLSVVSYGGTEMSNYKSLAEVCFARDSEWTLYDRLRDGFCGSAWLNDILGDREPEKLTDITTANAMHNTVWRFIPEEGGVYVFTANSVERTVMDIRRDLGEYGEEWLTGCGGTGQHSFVVLLRAGVQYNFYVGINDDGASFDNTDVSFAVSMESLAMDDLGKCGDNLTIGLEELEEGYKLVITGHGDMYDYYYEWDEEGNATDKSNPAPWRDFSGEIREIVFKGDATGGITHIGAHAFRDFSNLKSVTIPNTVTSIGTEAFSWCVNWQYDEESGCDCIVAGLSRIDIPASVTTIGGFAFGGCSCLETVTYGGKSDTSAQKALAEACADSGDYKDWRLYDILRDCFSESAWITELFSDISVETLSDFTEVHSMHFSYTFFTPETSGMYKFSVSAEEATSLVIYLVNGDRWELIADKNGLQYEILTCLEADCTYVIGGDIDDDSKTFVDRSIEFSLDCELTELSNLGSCGENLTWGLERLDEGYKLVITGHGDMTDYIYEWDDEGETEACFYQPWRDFSWEIHEIEFRADATGGITHIGDHAFRDFAMLDSIDIPDTVTSIGDEAFACCVYWEYDEELGESFIVGGLGAVTIPSSVTELGRYAFGACNYLESVSYGGGTDLDDYKKLADVCYAGEEDWGWTMYDRLRDCFEGSAWDNSIFGEREVDSLEDLTTAYALHAEYAKFIPAETDCYCFHASCDEIIGFALFTENMDRITNAFGTDVDLCACLYAGETYIVMVGLVDDGCGFEDVEAEVAVSVEPYNEGVCGETLAWSLEPLEDGGFKLTISGHGDMDDYFFAWDEQGNETEDCYPAPWYEFAWEIYEVEFVSDTAGGITHIGANAFRNFSNLTFIELPDTLKSVGREAFAWSVGYGYDDETQTDFRTGLSTLILPTDLEYIDDYAFGGCENLSEVSYGDNTLSDLKELAEKCYIDIEDGWSLYDAFMNVFSGTPWCDSIFYATEVDDAEALTEAYSMRHYRYFFITVEEDDAINYRISFRSDACVYAELFSVDDDDLWNWMAGESGTELAMNVRLREGKYAICVCLDEEEASFTDYSEPIAVTVDEIELTDYEVYTPEQLTDALNNKTIPVGAITIMNDLTVTEDSVLMPINENYCYAKLVIPEGVTVAVAEGAFFGAEIRNYEGNYADLLETGIINYGSILAEDTSELHIFGENYGSIAVEDSGFVRFQGTNYGTIDLHDETVMVAQYYGNFINEGTLTVDEDATLWSAMVGRVRNYELGEIALNGTYYVGYNSWEDGYNLWLDVDGGTFSGNGVVLVYENQEDDFLNDAIGDIEAMVNCSTITVRAAELPETPSYIGEGGKKWALEDNDAVELMICTDTVSYLTELTIDDEPLALWEEYYALEGGRLVFIDRAALDDLAVGEHTIVISYKTGDITLTLEVVKTMQAKVLVPEEKDGMKIDEKSAKEALGEVMEDVDISDKEITEESLKEALSGSVPANELPDIADKIREAVAKGGEISVKMNMAEKKSEEMDNKETLIIQKATKETDKIAKCIDVSVDILADGTSVGKIIQLKSTVTVTVELTPGEVGEIVSTAVVNTRLFAVQIHEGEAQYIPGAYNKETGDFEFESDSFSTFAIVARTYTRGDVDGKGNVDAGDLVAMAKYLSGENGNVNVPAVDTNGDNEQNLFDLVLLMKKLAGYDVTIY